MSEAAGRHTSIAVIEGYLGRGIEGVLGVTGDPPGRIVIDPHRATLAVRVPADGHTPDVVAFENLAINVIEDGGMMWHEMSVQLDDNAGDVYPVLCAVLDRVQLSGETFEHAVYQVLHSLTEILATRGGLSLEQQVGLFGELLTLLAVVDELGPETAISTWRGPASEEHDFGLPNCDLEIKTTLAEKRAHWISHLTQLVPTGGRPLYLASIQLTTAAVGAGWSLPSLVRQARNVAGIPVEALNTFLGKARFRDVDSDLYSTHWALRSSPAFFRVTSRFPAITPASLQASVPEFHRIVEVRYRVDLSGMQDSGPILSFDRVLNTEENP
jgi:hypothetical protein